MIVFATDQALTLLSRCNNWFGDGTFDVSPTIFYQLYTIHARYGKTVVPCVYALLPDKTEATYNRLLTEIAAHLNGNVPTDILFDFERAAINAAEIVFPGINVHGCFFHLSRNIWKKIQRCGLAALYENDDEFSLMMRMIAALAFVPIADVPQAFYDLEVEIRNNFNQNGIDAVLDYFEDTYVGRQRRRRPRARPMFPLELWNMHDRTQEELPRTNNHVEGWHRRFSGNVDCSHPTLWKLVKSFQREEGLVRAEINQYLGGHQVQENQQYVNRAERVLRIVEDYPVRRNNLLDEYLEQIALNLQL